MSSSTNRNADNTTTTPATTYASSCDKECDCLNIDTAAKQLTLKIEGLSIEKEEGVSNNNDNTDNIATCAACGKEGTNLNICNKCKMVHYCNVACKKKHKSKHKKKCDRRVAELHDVDLFKEPPPREECPICMLPLSLEKGESMFESCCGKIICSGCIHAMAVEDFKKGKKNDEVGICAFCRTLRPSSGEEDIKQLNKLMENGNADAFYQLAEYYDRGSYGLHQNRVKANELWLKAGELGHSRAYYRLGYSYHVGRGTEVDKKKAKHYYEIAAMKGDVHARHNLGALESKVGNHQRTYKHMIISARAGYHESLDVVKKGFTKGFVTKDEYESTLREYHERQTEMKSDAREAAADMLALCQSQLQHDA